ncbi:MAG: N-6 DNA methylase, partial [Acidobacteria bacterium]|nr:N-6 DNA methylase [Acidobacteriota bacterium]
GLPAPGREQAWPFVWKALRHLKGDGVAAFLLPAMGFLHNHARPAVEARKRLMHEARVCGVVNFADMRFQLFDKALRPAALIIFGRPQADAPYRFDYLTPKADLNLKSRRLITIGSGDRCRLDSRQVDADPFVFKKRLWMTEPEGRLFNYLSRFPRLGDLAVEFGALARKRKSAQNRWVVGQGFQPTKVDQIDRAAHERSHSSIVATTPYLPVDEFRIPILDCTGLQPWRDGFVRRDGFEAGFSGPRVLVPHGIAVGPGGPRLRAAYVEDQLTFQHIVQAITVPPGDERRGRLLAGLLNSRVMLWFAFHGTSSFGADRPKVQQAELLRLPFPAPENLPDPERSHRAADALVTVIDQQVGPAGQPPVARLDERTVIEKIDALTYEFFCLSETERILVEDTVENTIPAAQPNRGNLPEIWNASTRSDRRAYARTLVDNLMDWLDDDCAIGARLVARNDDLAILRLTLRDGRSAFDYTEDEETPVGAELARLARNIEQPLPGNLQSTPNFRVFLDRDLFLVKPAAKRFWLRSAAVADAHAIALDLQGFVGRRHDDRPGPD